MESNHWKWMHANTEGIASWCALLHCFALSAVSGPERTSIWETAVTKWQKDVVKFFYMLKIERIIIKTWFAVIWSVYTSFWDTLYICVCVWSLTVQKPSILIFVRVKEMKWHIYFIILNSCFIKMFQFSPSSNSGCVSVILERRKKNYHLKSISFECNLLTGYLRAKANSNLTFVTFGTIPRHHFCNVTWKR